MNGVRVTVALWVWVGCLCVGCSAMAADRPNVLLIVSEDNGPELGCYGEPYVQTPVLDSLAKDGVRFDKAYVPQAGCSQSRAALLTGLFPHQNGQIGLATWKFRMYREDTPNLVRSLKQSGYRTGLIGKLHINPKSAFPFDVHVHKKSNFARDRLADYAKHAEDFIMASDEPFFLSVNYPDAHRPFLKQVEGLPAKPLAPDDVKPLAYFGLDTPQLRSDTADYYNCMSRLDSLIGDLLQALDRSGKSKETMVIYMGDHGADLLRGKRTSYEGGVRVPLIIRWPGKGKRDHVSNNLVSTLDITPTILEVTESKAIEGLPGKSLLPLLDENGSEDAVAWRKYLFTEYHLHSAHNFYPQRTVRDQRFKLIQNLLPGEVNPGYEFTVRKFYKGLPTAIQSARPAVREAYLRMRRPPEFELYDLQADPYEFQNLAQDTEHSATLLALKQQLAARRATTEDPLLDRDNLAKLKAEVESCFVKGVPDKKSLNLQYPEFFFDKLSK